MAKIDVTGLQIVLFRNMSDNPKAPALSGVVKDADNNEVGQVALWYADDKETGEKRLDKNGNPFLRGKVSEPRPRRS